MWKQATNAVASIPAFNQTIGLMATEYRRYGNMVWRENWFDVRATGMALLPDQNKTRSLFCKWNRLQRVYIHSNISRLSTILFRMKWLLIELCGAAFAARAQCWSRWDWEKTEKIHKNVNLIAVFWFVRWSLLRVSLWIYVNRSLWWSNW